MAGRMKHAPEFKARVALEEIKGQKTMAELCQEYNLHESIIQRWKSTLQQNSAAVFAKGAVKVSNGPDVSQLHAKIGELLVERDFLKKALKI